MTAGGKTRKAAILCDLWSTLEKVAFTILELKKPAFGAAEYFNFILLCSSIIAHPSLPFHEYGASISVAQHSSTI